MFRGKLPNGLLLVKQKFIEAGVRDPNNVSFQEQKIE